MYEFMGLLLDEYGAFAFAFPVIIGLVFTLFYLGRFVLQQSLSTPQEE